MAVTANSIITPQAVKLATAVCTSANTALDSPTQAVSLLTAGTNGAVLYRLTALPRATVTATKLQLYRYASSTYYYIGESLMAAYTMAQTTTNPGTDFGFAETSPLRLNASDELRVAIGVSLAGGIVFTAQYEDL
jgi:hypothetical protein